MDEGTGGHPAWVSNSPGFPRIVTATPGVRQHEKPLYSYMYEPDSAVCIYEHKVAFLFLGTFVNFLGR